MSRKYIILSVLSIIFVAFFAYVLPVLAFDLKLGIVGNLPYECRVNGNCGFCDFIDLFIILQKVILSLFGGLALIMIIWGGINIITSAGNSQKMAEGKKLIFSTLLGVLIILGGYFLIAILVTIMASPSSPDGVNKNNPTSGILVWQGNWLKAFCADKTDTDFCKTRTDGTPCGVRGKCQGGQCISACEYDYGREGYKCKNINTCQENNAIGGNPANCNANTLCYRGLCPSNEITEVCCK